MRTQKKLHRIAIKIYSDLVAQLNPTPMKDFENFDVLYRVLTQQRNDTNKVYSIHEPDVLCIAKGKEHKPYEFGNKSSIAIHVNPGSSSVQWPSKETYLTATH